MTEEYNKYLLSPEWKEIRNKVIELYKTCVMCGGGKPLQVHHRNYKNIFKENIYTDLTLLCLKCHSNHHRIKSKKINKKQKKKEMKKKDKRQNKRKRISNNKQSWQINNEIKYQKNRLVDTVFSNKDKKVKLGDFGKLIDNAEKAI